MDCPDTHLCGCNDAQFSPHPVAKFGCLRKLTGTPFPRPTSQQMIVRYQIHGKRITQYQNGLSDSI